MRIPLVDLSRQYEALRPQADRVVTEVLTGAHYIMGPYVAGFEKDFASRIGVSYAVSVGNGTDALVIALKALGIGKGDEVITSPYTFFATAEAIAAVGAKPVFVDVRPDTYNINEALIEEKITPRTKAVLPVHIFGQCADMPAICSTAHAHGLYVIEDACQAAGATFQGKAAGGLSDISCFSFFPTKNLSCAGDGGMICTGHEDIAVACRALRAHGGGEMGERAYNRIHGIQAEVSGGQGDTDHTVYNEKKYYNYLIAQNSRLDELQAAILSLKLPRLEEYIANRRRTAAFYTQAFSGLPLITPFEDTRGQHAYHLYVLQSERRSDILAYLKEKEVATGVYYPVPLHLQKCFSDLGYRAGDMPVAEKLSQRMFAIPLFPEITEQERGYVASAVREAALKFC